MSRIRELGGHPLSRRPVVLQYGNLPPLGRGGAAFGIELLARRDGLACIIVAAPGDQELRQVVPSGGHRPVRLGELLEDLVALLVVAGCDVGLGEGRVGAGEGHAALTQVLQVLDRFRIALQLDVGLGEVVARGRVVVLVDRLLVGRDGTLTLAGIERVVASLDVVTLARRQVVNEVQSTLRVLRRLVLPAQIAG